MVSCLPASSTRATLHGSRSGNKGGMGRVLEPIARVRVVVPIAFTSSVISQLTVKRGQILGMSPDDRAGYDEQGDDACDDEHRPPAHRTPSPLRTPTVRPVPERAAVRRWRRQTCGVRHIRLLR